MRRFLHDNGLSIIVFALFIVFVAGHSVAGFLALFLFSFTVHAIGVPEHTARSE
jgi:hypothetical protein